MSWQGITRHILHKPILDAALFHRVLGGLQILYQEFNASTSYRALVDRLFYVTVISLSVFTLHKPRLDLNSEEGKLEHE